MPRITTTPDRRIATAEPVDWEQVEPEIIYRIIMTSMAGTCFPVRMAASIFQPHYLLRRPEPPDHSILRYCIFMHQRVMSEVPVGQRAQEIWQQYLDTYMGYWDRFGLNSEGLRASNPPPNL